MFFGINLQEILLFPLKDAESRKHLYIGAAVGLAGMVVPLLPFILLFGYGARIAKQVLAGESPRMIPWEDWGGLFNDGLRVFGVRMVASLPLLIFALPVMLASFGLAFAAPDLENGNTGLFIGLFSLTMFGVFCVIVPLSLALAFILPAAELHAVEQNEFAAGLRVKEWWPIFRANIGGFLAAFVVYYVLSMALALVMQIAMATLILICLMPVFIALLSAYPTLVMYALNAQAYKEGKTALQAAQTWRKTD